MPVPLNAFPYDAPSSADGGDPIDIRAHMVGGGVREAGHHLALLGLVPQVDDLHVGYGVAADASSHHHHHGGS